MLALRRILPEIQFDLSHIPYETLAQLEIGMDDFLGALAEIEPSATREVFVEVPDVRWDDVGGLADIKQQLVEAVEWPVKYGPLLAHGQVQPPSGVLLHGPPGTGKTLVVKALATETEVNFIPVKGPELMSKWVGESEKGVREVFRKARQAAPCIVFFDEIDALVPRRAGGGADTTHVSERVISQMLTEIDGLEELKGVTVIGATNRLDIVDPALLRAGRFDTLLELRMPDEGSRTAIFRIHTAGKPLAEDVDLASLVSTTDGLTGADIEALCTKATMLAIRQFIESRDGQVGEDYTALRVGARHFHEALTTVKQEARQRAEAEGVGDDEDDEATYV
jgi:transitional endoplasmic reticulum ATPase